jgi:Na+/H+ antiporter NhaD/arsenite permease-like protein
MEFFSFPAFWILLSFIVGYLFIVLEQVTEISKTTVALLMAVVCWSLLFTNVTIPHAEHVETLNAHLGKASEIVLFLLGALAIVEVISVHNGFWLVTRLITAKTKIALLWVVGLTAFFLSAILDNLTTTVVMVTLLRQLVAPSEDRLLMGGAIVIAANAGGAWTPIGDVTTTMLWIGGQVTAWGVIKAIFMPSLVCVVVSMLCLSYQLRSREPLRPSVEGRREVKAPFANLVFVLGISALLFVPIFRQLTGLPPLMGMLFGLSVLWLVTDLLHARFHDRRHLRVPSVLSRIDIAGVLFFLGILLAVDTLAISNILQAFATWIDRTVPSHAWTALIIGLGSAVVDNVPLVAASMGMYDLSNIPPGSVFWHEIAYAAGTGGSILVIGSAAGVALMGLENVSFFWWVRRVSFAALLGFLAGFGAYHLWTAIN